MERGSRWRHYKGNVYTVVALFPAELLAFIGGSWVYLFTGNGVLAVVVGVVLGILLALGAELYEQTPDASAGKTRGRDGLPPSPPSDQA